jgi:hypothetical protein
VTDETITIDDLKSSVASDTKEAADKKLSKSKNAPGAKVPAKPKVQTQVKAKAKTPHAIIEDLIKQGKM